MSNLVGKIESVRQSIVAIGFKPDANKITIVGSGFSVAADGKVASAAHLYNQLNRAQADSLTGMAMVKRDPGGLEHYQWLPLRLLKKDDKNDLALFQIENYEQTLLKKLELGDSDGIEAGGDVYFIGFPYAGQLINEGFGITLVTSRAIISNVKRDGVDPKHPRNFFIVDAISNPGNSGSPLLDLETNKVIGIMTIAFRTRSKTNPDLDIREPMHIAGARPINLAEDLFRSI